MSKWSDAVILGTLLVALGCILASQSPLEAQVNPNSSEKAREILGLLTDLPNRNRVISGQSMASSNTLSSVDTVFNQTGKWVGILGAEYTNWGDRVVWRDVNPYMIDHWNKGGLVEIHFHPYSPRNGHAEDDGLNIDDVLVSGGTYYDAFRAELDEVVQGLSELRDHGIVVLWRPVHAADNDNYFPFWWTGNPDRYHRIWQYIFDYLTSRGLNNLLWVQSFNHGQESTGGGGYPNNQYPASSYYVGDAYVDVVGLDTGEAVDFTAYSHLIRFGKPFAMAEFFTSGSGGYDYRNVINQIRDNSLRVSYFCVFVKYGGENWDIASNLFGRELLEDPWILNAGDIFGGPPPPP